MLSILGEDSNWQDPFFCGIMIAMPSWNIHLEAGERLADKLHFSGDKRREFLLGCLLPDINNGYVNHPEIVKKHSETHYAYDQKSSLNFYAENKRQIDAKNPIYLGYIFHLFTDGFFNYDFFHRAKHDPSIGHLDKEQKNDIKHHDFWLYDTKIHHELDIPPEEISHYVSIANQINPVEINDADLAELIQIMIDDSINDPFEDDEYQFYTEHEIAELLDRTIEGFSEQYLGEDYA